MSLCVYTNVLSLRYSLFFELKFLILTAVASEMNPKGISNLGEYLLFEQRPSRSPVSDMICRRTRWREVQSQEVHLIENRY